MQTDDMFTSKNLLIHLRTVYVLMCYWQCKYVTAGVATFPLYKVHYDVLAC